MCFFQKNVLFGGASRFQKQEEREVMTSRFLSRNGETYRVLHQDGDGCWLISFDNPTERPFRAAATEMDSFQRVPAPQDFSSEDCNLSSAAQKRLCQELWYNQKHERAEN